MSTENITFDNDTNYKFKSRAVFGQAEVPGMTRFLLRKGIVKSEKMATNVLAACTILFLMAAAWVMAVFVFDIQIGSSASDQLKEKRDHLRELSKQKNKNQ